MIKVEGKKKKNLLNVKYDVREIIAATDKYLVEYDKYGGEYLLTISRYSDGKYVSLGWKRIISDFRESCIIDEDSEKTLNDVIECFIRIARNNWKLGFYSTMSRFDKKEDCIP